MAEYTPDSVARLVYQLMSSEVSPSASQIAPYDVCPEKPDQALYQPEDENDYTIQVKEYKPLEWRIVLIVDDDEKVTLKKKFVNEENEFSEEKREKPYSVYAVLKDMIRNGCGVAEKQAFEKLYGIDCEAVASEIESGPKIVVERLF